MAGTKACRSDGGDQPMHRTKCPRSSRAGMWICVAAGIFVVVAGGGVGLFFLLHKDSGDGDSPADGVVGKPGLDLSRRLIALERIHYAMPRTRVEKIYGLAGPASAAMIDRTLEPNAQASGLAESARTSLSLARQQGRDCVYYSDGENYLYIEYETDRLGVPRVWFTRWTGPEKGKRTTTMGVSAFREEPTHERAKKLDKVYALLDDPRWARGAELPRRLLGRWACTDHTYIFRADGTVRFPRGQDFDTFPYRFLDDELIEMKVPSSNEPVPYYVLCDDRELYLVTWSSVIPQVRGP